MTNEKETVVFDETHPFLTDCVWVGNGLKLDFFQITEEPGFNIRKAINQYHVEELRANIKEQGLINPIEVVFWKMGLVGGVEKALYKIVCGHNRWLAIKKLVEEDKEGMFKSFNISVINKKTPDEKLLIRAYCDNIADHINIADECEFLARFVKMGWSYTQIYEKFGFQSASYPTVRNRIIVGRYGTVKMLDALRNGDINFTDALKMVSENDKENEIDKDEIQKLNLDDKAKNDMEDLLETFDSKRKKQLEEKKRKKVEDFESHQKFFAIAIANFPNEDVTDFMDLINKFVKKYKLEIRVDKITKKFSVSYDREENDIEDEYPGDVGKTDDGDTVIDE